MRFLRTLAVLSVLMYLAEPLQAVTPTMTPTPIFTSTRTPSGVTTVLLTPTDCQIIEVKGLENCAHGGADLEKTVAVKVPVVQGATYRIRRVSGCIDYGQYADANGNAVQLYGTRIRIFNSMDAVGAGLGRIGSVGYGSYAMGYTKPTCAEALAQSVPYDTTVITPTGSYLFFTPDDIYGGYCLDNSGSEVVEICRVTALSTATATSTPTWTWTPTNTFTWTSTWTSVPVGTPTDCQSIEVKGRENCTWKLDLEPSVAVKVSVVPGALYRIRRVSGCIDYGQYADANGNAVQLYGTRLRIFNSADKAGTGLALAATVGYGSYAMGYTKPTCAEALAQSAPYDTTVITPTGSYLFFTPDDIYGGYCDDNSGSEVVEICRVDVVPTATATVVGSCPGNLCLVSDPAQNRLYFDPSDSVPPADALGRIWTDAKYIASTTWKDSVIVTSPPGEWRSACGSPAEGRNWLAVTATGLPPTGATAYFRNAFTLPENATVNGPLTLNLNGDNIVEVWLNDHFVGRFEGPYMGDSHLYDHCVEIAVDPTWFKGGTNALAFRLVNQLTYHGLSYEMCLAYACGTPVPPKVSVTSTPTGTSTPTMEISATPTPTPTTGCHKRDVCHRPVPRPNPSRGEPVCFRFDEGPYDEVRVDVYTQCSRLLYSEKRRNVGEECTMTWNLKDVASRVVSNGLYIVVLKTQKGSECKRYTEKVLILR
jgi:hypothetical protein